MSRHARRAHMTGSGSDSLVPPQMVAVEAGHQEQLKMSHVMVNDNYFGVDPNANFDSSTILCEDRVYVCDTTPSATQPVTFSIQPQFNTFRSLSESRFVFQVSLSGQNTSNGTVQWVYAPKPFFSALFVQDITININNVNTSDQHSSTAQYSHFIKTILFDANIKSPNVSCLSVVNANAGPSFAYTPVPYLNYGYSNDDSRTLTEGIINTDWINGLSSLNSTHGSILSAIDGTFDNSSFTNNGSAIEITYRPRDGIWLTPKMLPPGVVENFIIRLNSVGNVFQCANTYINPGLSASSSYYQWVDQALGSNVSMNIVSAKYYERQYTPTQSALRSYQSLISMQPVYIPVVSANCFLVPVPAGQNSVALQNVLAGRVPNIVVIGLLNQNAVASSLPGPTISTGVAHQLRTYSPLPAADIGNVYKQCLSSVRLTLNGRLYNHLFSINCAVNSTQDTSQLYEMYKQCCLIKDLNGRNDGSSNVNMNQQFKMDNPILSFGEFRTNFTFFCFNVRRNGTLPNCSGDKEVGGVDILATIDTQINALSGLSQLLVVGINSDSICSITDGGSTTSFVY